MTDFLISWSHDTWSTVLDAAPWLLFGFALADGVYVLLPVAKVTRHLGGAGWSGVLKAALVGVPLPLCSCSVIPVASAMRKRGMGRGAFMSFLISTPESGVDSIAISYALLGPLLAVVRPVAALVSAVIAGLLVGCDAVHEELRERKTVDAGTTAVSCCCASEDTDDTAPVPSSGAGQKVVQSLWYGFVDMVADLAPWLLLGFLLAGLLTAALPDRFLDEHLGGGISTMLLMLVVGLPMYICATASTPIAAALIVKGLSPGAALVLLLVGPATNIATMLIVVRELGKRGLVIYLLSIAVVAVGFGLATDWVAEGLSIRNAARAGSHDHTASGGAVLAGSVLALLIANGLRIRLVSWWRMRVGSTAAG